MPIAHSDTYTDTHTHTCTHTHCLKPYHVFLYLKPPPMLKSATERIQTIKEVEGQG